MQSSWTKKGEEKRHHELFYGVCGRLGLRREKKGATFVVLAGAMSSDSAAEAEAEDCGSALFLGLPDDVLALVSARLRPADLCALALGCRSLLAAVGASEKVWLAQCCSLGPPRRVLLQWRKGVRSYRALCRFLTAVSPLLGIWVHQNPELGNVVCVDWGFLSVVGVRVIPQEVGPLGLEAGPLLWAPVFEIMADASGAASRFFLHGRDCSEDFLYPGTVRSIDSFSNVLLLEADARKKDSTFHPKTLNLLSARSFSAAPESSDPKFTRKYRRPHTDRISRPSFTSLPAPPPSPPFSRLSFSDRRRLLETVAARIRLRVPRDLAAAPLFERSSSSDDASLLTDRSLELFEMLKLSGGWVDRKSAESVLGSSAHRNATSSDTVECRPSTATGKRRAFSSVTGYLKQFIGRSASPATSCPISRNGNPSGGGGKNKNAQLHEFLESGDVIGLSLRAAHMRLTSYRAWPNMHENRFALYKLPLQAPAAGREHAGLWGGTFGWPPGRPAEGKPGKALFFLLLSYEEIEGRRLLIATKILEGTHHVLHPNGSAMFIAKIDEPSPEPEPFPWDIEGESPEVEIKSSFAGEGIANGYGFRFPGSKPGTLFVLRDGLLAFMWKESRSILILQKVKLQELVKKGERVPALPPIANFSYLTKSYSNVFTGFSTSSGHSSSPTNL